MPDFLVFAAIIPKILGSFVILDIHDPMPNTFITKFKVNKNNWIYKLLLFEEKISAKFADCVITVNEPVKIDILVKEGIPENKISVIRNFADENIFKLVDDYHINGTIRLIFYGTIAERFGFKKIIEALSKLTHKESIYLKIIGEGDYASKLKSLIIDSGLEIMVNFNNRSYPVKELPNILKSYHLGLVSYDLSPATDYMLPVKMMEMLLMGIPVITIGNKAIKYYFDEQQYFSYDSNDLNSLVDLIVKIRNNPDLIRSKRENILKVREEFNWSEESKRYQQLLLNLIEEYEYEKN
jgi:glycosyltransferase involved in cell wall biosynthesis